jgi:ABC-type polysaccharide/polyol phosphate transport system ATPase subunit
MMSNIAIKVSHLTKVYKLYDKPIDRLKESLHPLKKQYHKDFYALSDVSFEIKKGETVGIIGKNGAGKSTLLKIITGVLTPSSGHVHVNGRIASLLELGAGFNPEYTGVENIYLQGTLMGYSKKEMDIKIDEILSFADIGDFIYQPVKSYSSGMFARLAFAIAINVDPDILIVDEALAVGDVFFVQKCMAKLDSFKKAGKTILFVSHDTAIIKNICNKALFIKNGELVANGNAVEVSDTYLAYLFKREVNQPKEEVEKDTFCTKANEENYIPNLQKRLGNQKCQILGIGLYDKEMNSIQSVCNNSIIILRMTFKNISETNIDNLSIGYILKNFKGIEISSNNTITENFLIKNINMNATETINITMKIPFLHPGTYTFTVSIASKLPSNEFEIIDWIDNAISLEIYSRVDVHTIMTFKTKYEMENW